MKKENDLAVEYRPIKKIIIHAIYELSYDDFVKEIFLYPNPMNIFWADGYLFIFTPLQIDGNPDIMKDFIDGTVHWQEVIYCKSKKPENMTIKNGVLEAKIIDATEMYPHAGFVAWLKTLDRK
jgi:hypothetical protein